ncbi:uncharacterized protein LOC113306375 [Papaver somniferum]|uniref:uncharacterized protein LOC113306375 n=1 Tax=Papaver somniferum TaxID=3469 RepID=UPI000E6FF453|nr:uncharacterized protein LOC113306375 [Papaver somniferum]
MAKLLTFGPISGFPTKLNLTHILSDRNMPNYVCDLMNVNGDWDMCIISTYIDIAYHDAIKSITTNTSMHDRIRWKSTISGNLTTKSVYNFLTNLSFDKDETNFWKQIWKLNMTPKVNMFCWKVVTNALALGKNMSKYVKDSKPYCMLCDNHELEDERHFFVKCNFAKKVWKAFDLNNIYHNSGSTEILQWFKTWMNVKALNSKHNLISYIVWSIWKYRNNVNFDNFVPDVQKLIDSIRASHVSTNAKKYHCNSLNSESDNYDWVIHFDASFIEADFTM